MHEALVVLSMDGSSALGSSAASLPGLQVHLRSLLPIVSPPGMNWGLLFATIRFILTFGFI